MITSLDLKKVGLLAHVKAGVKSATGKLVLMVMAILVLACNGIALGADRTVTFSTADPGVTKSIPNWGYDTVWGDPNNMRRACIFMSNTVNCVRIAPATSTILTNGTSIWNSTLSTADKAQLSATLDLARSLTPNAQWYFTCGGVNTNWYISGTNRLYSDRYAAMWEANVRYLNTLTNAPSVPWIDLGNEPDLQPGVQGSAQDYYNTLGYLTNNADFAGKLMGGVGTLNSDVASIWFSSLLPRATLGSTHNLAGSCQHYVDFLQSCTANNCLSFEPEAHNVGECIIGAEYGLDGAIWWGYAELARGEFAQACQGKRLGYAEHRTNWTAAAVYRAPSGKVQAFVGESERTCLPTTYEFYCTDRPVFYDGYGPQRSYTVQTSGGPDYGGDAHKNCERMVNITWGEDVQPAISGRYVLVNRNSGKVMEVASASTNNGANIQQNTYNGSLNQQWDFLPLSYTNGQDWSSFKVTAAHSGKCADVANLSYDNGGNIQQWDVQYTAGAANQQWFLDYVGDGWFYIRSKWNKKCIDVAGLSKADGANIAQWDPNGGLNQQWRFLPVGAAIEFVAPAAPTGVLATNNPMSIQVTWNANTETDLASYTVLRSITNGGSYEIIARGITATSFTDYDVTRSVPYYYVVKAVDQSLNRSTNSSQVSAALPATLPAGWGDANIGSPAYTGSGSYTNGFWTLRGGGADIWNNADQFYFCTDSLNGDGMIMAQVTAESGSDPWAQAGVMIRGDASAGAAEASISITPGNGITFRYRLNSNAATSLAGPAGITVPTWVRLSRSNNVVTASYSTNGTSWTKVGSSQAISLNANALAGLCVTAHNNALTNIATFNNVLIESGPQTGAPADLANETVWQTTWPMPQINNASNAITPPMGWNSWFVVNGKPGPSESLILATAAALVTNGLAAAGYKYVVIDCTWLATPGRGSRDANGNLVVNSTYWPHGMKYVSDYVHSKGLLMGGYTDIGALGYAITNSQIGSFAYYQQDANQFAAWGWDFVKIDDHGPGDFYAAAYAIANNASNRPIVVSLSCPQTDAVKFGTRIANSYRVSSDISLDYTGGSVAWSDILREFDVAQADWFAQAPGRWSDPDMFCTGMNGISDLEGRTHFNMWCILGAPLMIGTDVRKTGGNYPPPLSAATLATMTNTEAIAVDQDSLGAVGTAVANNIYAKPLGSFVSGQFAVLLLNRASSTANLTVNWADLGLTVGSSASVRDLWAHSDLGNFIGNYIVTNIPAHGSVLLKITGTFDWNRSRIYEAESGYNTYSGTAYYVPHASTFSATAYVTGIGNGAANALQFNKVTAPSDGLYEVDIYYASAVARTAQLSVNGGAATNIFFPATGSDTSPSVITTYQHLNAGENTLAFSNPTNLAPNFDKIVVSRGTPAGFVAVAGDSVVNLSWTAAAGSTSFNLYRGASGGSEFATPYATGLASTEFADTNVVNGQTYFYTVTAINPAFGGETSPSIEASAKPSYATTSMAYQTAMLGANPYVWWRLNETNGALFYDAIGTRNGTNAGAVASGVAGPRPPDFLGFEMTNTATQFVNGTANSWINIPALNLNTNTVTITAWIYPTGSQADYAGLLFCRSGGTVAGLCFGGNSFSSNGGMLGYSWNNDQNTWSWSSGLTPPAYQWSFVTLVIQPASAILYLLNTNGQQTATNTYTHPNQAFSGAGTIGTDSYSSAARAFNGMLDEAAVFNYALTSAQIQSLFANGNQLSQVNVGLQKPGANLNLTWPQGTLLQSTNITGPWFRASSSASPLSVSPTNGTMFYRVFLKQ